MDKFNDFEKLDGQGAAEETPAVAGEKVAKNAANKERERMMVDLLKDKINNDPTFRGRHCSLSQSLTVENSLSFGDSGNLVVNKEGKAFIGKNGKERYPLEKTSQIVGYRVRNIGDQPIRYTTEVYKKNENGQYVGQVEDKVLEPGGFADLTRKYMTVFTCIPEISFQLANGKVMRGSSKRKANDLDAELEAYYFSFSDRSIKVNSDAVKMNISTKTKTEDGTVKWVVKDEFVETFGFLNNAKEAASKGEGRRKSRDWTSQDMAANYVATLLQKGGKL